MVNEFMFTFPVNTVWRPTITWYIITGDEIPGACDLVNRMSTNYRLSFIIEVYYGKREWTNGELCIKSTGVHIKCPQLSAEVDTVKVIWR